MFADHSFPPLDEYGISGPFWYAAGATIQILLFAMLAAKIKSNAPYATTFLQIIKTRWGTGAHLSFMFFALATNALVSAQLLLGGSAVVNALTGIPTIAAIFLIPLCGSDDVQLQIDNSDPRADLCTPFL